MYLEWEDGVEQSPRGMAREYALEHVHNSSVWLTPVGDAYRRYYNKVDKSFAWEAMPLVWNADGTRLGLHVSEGLFVTLEHAIACCWLARAPHSRARVRVLDPDRAITAANLAWPDPDTSDDDVGDETWYKLDWHCGLIRCNPAYQISSKARLRSPHTGLITRGHALHGTRWAAVKGAGLVDLHAAAGLARHEVSLSPSHFRAWQALSKAEPPRSLARRAGIQESTAWAQYTKLAPLVMDRRQIARQLVPRRLWDCLIGMQRNPVLGGALTELHAAVAKKLGSAPEWTHLRFARRCLV